MEADCITSWSWYGGCHDCWLSVRDLLRSPLYWDQRSLRPKTPAFWQQTLGLDGLTLERSKATSSWIQFPAASCMGYGTTPLHSSAYNQRAPSPPTWWKSTNHLRSAMVRLLLTDPEFQLHNMAQYLFVAEARPWSPQDFWLCLCQASGRLCLHGKVNIPSRRLQRLGWTARGKSELGS